MRRVLVSEMITLDGFFAGPNGEIDWHNVDEEFNVFANEQLDSVGTLLFGRLTYEVMVSYWPTPNAATDDPIIAGKMNNLPKVVFSKTLDKTEWGTWNNARLVKSDLVSEVGKLKQQPGKDMVVFGSGSIVAALTDAGLIDEYRIFVNPVVLGDGIPLFKGMKNRHSLKLLRTQIFKSGNVLLYYGPAGKA